MVNPIVSTVAEPNPTNQVAQSISQQQRKDPPKEQSDSTKNQLSTNDFCNSDPIVEWRNSSEITEMAARLLISPLEVPKEAETSPEDGTRKRQDLSKIGRMEEDFDKGYDSDCSIPCIFQLLEVAP